MHTLGAAGRRAGWVVPALLALCLTGCGGGGTSSSGAATPRHTPSSTPSSTSSAPTPSASASSTSRPKGIPDDFPLAQGLATDSETKVSSPRHGAVGLVLDPRCWGHAWPGRVVDTLVVHQTGPELGVTRELVLYRNPGKAAAAVRVVRAKALACHRLPADADGGAMDVTMQRGGDGAAHVSFSETLRHGRPGGSLLAFTRVGRAVLAVEDGGEWTRASAVAGMRQRQRADRPVVARMCLFSRAGC